MGLILLAAGIYLFVQIREIMVFNLAFTIIGGVIALFAFSSCCLRVSKVRLFLYNLTSNVLCLLDIALTVGYWIKRSWVIDKLVEYSDNEENVQDIATNHQHTIGYILIGTCAVTFLVSFFGWLYYCSVRKNTQELNEHLFRRSVN